MTSMAERNHQAIVDRVEWMKPGHREAALVSLAELDALERKLQILPGRSGCMNEQVKQAAALLDLDTQLFRGLLVSAVSNLTEPKDSFEFEMLATRTKSGARLAGKTKKGGR